MRNNADAHISSLGYLWLIGGKKEWSPKAQRLTITMINVDELDDDDDDDDLSGVAFKYWSFDALLPLYLFSGIVFRRIACPVVHHCNFQTIPVEKEHFYFKRAHHMLLNYFDNLRVVNDMIAEQNV